MCLCVSIVFVVSVRARVCNHKCVRACVYACVYAVNHNFFSTYCLKVLETFRLVLNMRDSLSKRAAVVVVTLKLAAL